MTDIPNDIRAKLKRLSPYAGPFVPDSVKENARDLWPYPYDPDTDAGWQWDDGSGFYQWELELCNLDAIDLIDSAGHVAIRPLAQGGYLLVFVLGLQWRASSGDLVFPSIQATKAFLDTLLALSTPQIQS